MKRYARGQAEVFVAAVMGVTSGWLLAHAIEYFFGLAFRVSC